MLLTHPSVCQRYGGLSIMGEIKVKALEANYANPPALDRHGRWMGVEGFDTSHFPSHAWDETAGPDPNDYDSDGDDDDDLDPDLDLSPQPHVAVPRKALDYVMSHMVIIVPCKNEPTEIIEKVLSFIPPACMVILVSNSTRLAPGQSRASAHGCPYSNAADGHANGRVFAESQIKDKYLEERNMLRRFCREGRRPAVAIHQRDPGAAEAFNVAGMPEVLVGRENDLRFRDGKGEGMLLGVALAAALCPERKYVGFIDADNRVPGAVEEYCRAYAAGFAMYPSEEHVMVRIHWDSKPKGGENGEIEFVSEGRSSKVVNAWLNKLLARLAQSPSSSESSCGSHLSQQSDIDGFLVTGNAGEHAMTMRLAMQLRVASGYAIEPFHYLDLLERLGGPQSGDNDSDSDDPARIFPFRHHRKLSSARILQIRTSNPHIHRSSDDSHIRRMRTAALGAIYHHLPLLPLLASGSRTSNYSVQKHYSGKTRRTPASAFAQEILKYVAENEVEEDSLDAGAMEGQKTSAPELPRPHIYPSMARLNMGILGAVVREHSLSLRRYRFPRELTPETTRVATPELTQEDTTMM